MDIQLVDMAVSGSRCRGLEETGSDLVPDITDNPKAVEVIAELIDKLPDIEVRGSLEKW